MRTINFLYISAYKRTLLFRVDVHYTLVDDYIPLITDNDTTAGVFTGVTIGEDAIWVNHNYVTVLPISTEENGTYFSDIPVSITT